MRRTPSSLQLSSAVAVVAVVATFVAPGVWWLRAPFGLALVALLPGHGIVAALPALDDLGRAERTTLAVGLSLACAILVGFPLALAVRLGPASWVLTLAAMTLAANTAAHLRAPRPAAPRVAVPPGLAAAAVLASAFALAMLFSAAGQALPPAGGEIVQLWALPAGSPGPNDIEIGVANRLSPGSRFKLKVWQGEAVLLEKDVDVPVGGTARILVRPPSSAPTSTPLRAVLTQAGSGSERAVTVWPGATPTAARR